MFVSPNYFRTIGVALERGAGFDPIEDAPLAAPEVILSYDYWQDHMGADPNIIGKTLTLDDIPHVVVGVGPEHFASHISLTQDNSFFRSDVIHLSEPTSGRVPTPATSGCTSLGGCHQA